MPTPHSGDLYKALMRKTVLAKAYGQPAPTMRPWSSERAPATIACLPRPELPTEPDPSACYEPACDRECLTWEEHLDHIAGLRVVADEPEDVAGWEQDKHANLPGAIARDLATLQSLLRQQEWKAACLIGGGLLEALLYERVSARGAEARAYGELACAQMRRREADELAHVLRRPVERWTSYALILVAAGIKILSARETEQAHRARRARNAIHSFGRTVGRGEAREVRDVVRAVLEKRNGEGQC